MHPIGDTARSALHWRLEDRKTRWLLIGLIAFLGGMIGLTIGVELTNRIYGDFFAMWSFARFPLTHPAAQIYDPDVLHAFQQRYDPTIGWMPFPYPPFYMLMVAPFGLPPIAMGWALWSVGGLAAYLTAIFAGRWRGDTVLFVVLAPTTVMALMSGQNGLFSAALLIGGARLMGTRPILAGVMFGLMTFKPQIGLLIPVALVSARAWRCFWAASLTVLGLVVAATLAFGASIWMTWITAMQRHWSGYVVQGNATRVKMPTITANLELLGASPQLAQAAQLMAMATAAVVVWLGFRKGADRWGIILLLVGSFLAAPYALFYDLPPVTFAIVLAISEMARADKPWRLAEVVVLLFAYVSPYGQFLVGISPVPISGAALVLLFIVGDAPRAARSSGASHRDDLTV